MSTRKKRKKEMKKRAAGVGTIQAFKGKELLNFLTLKPNNE